MIPRQAGRQQYVSELSDTVSVLIAIDRCVSAAPQDAIEDKLDTKHYPYISTRSSASFSTTAVR